MVKKHDDTNDPPPDKKWWQQGNTYSMYKYGISKDFKFIEEKKSYL
jgi:hypothetical protein